jgi:hypothetical protein
MQPKEMRSLSKEPEDAAPLSDYSLIGSLLVLKKFKNSFSSRRREKDILMRMEQAIA